MFILIRVVSTHSRPKAAVYWFFHIFPKGSVSTHSRPKAAAFCIQSAFLNGLFQHTAARRQLQCDPNEYTNAGRVSTHSRPKAAASINRGCWVMKKFQHTAARRQLALRIVIGMRLVVSTHSRPKAAVPAQNLDRYLISCFNTQPPEGSWPCIAKKKATD